MSDFALDANGDLDISGGDFGNVSDVDTPEAVAQRLKIHLRTFQGEWFLNRAAGVPYMQYILGKKMDTATITILNSVFTRAILETPGIRRLKSAIKIRIDRATRQTAIEFQCETTNGETLTMSEALS